VLSRSYSGRSEHFFCVTIQINKYTQDETSQRCSPDQQMALSATNIVAQNQESKDASERILLHPLTLRFQGSQAYLEDQFYEDYFYSSLPIIRCSLIFAIFLFAIFGLLDAYLLPDRKTTIWVIRYALLCPLTFCVFLLTYTKVFKKVMQLVIACSAVVAGSGIIAMTIIAPPPVSFSYYAGVILIFMMAYTCIKLHFIWATAAGWFLVFFYEFSGFFLADTPTPILVNNSFFFISANLIGMLACYAIEYYTRRDFYLKKLLDKKRTQVIQAKEVLEQKVRERTSQLTKLNETLQQEMKERKRLQSRQVRYHKMEAVGLMAGGVAHDLNNILAGITGYPELLLMQLPEESELRKPIAAIQESGERAAAVVADLLTVARGAASIREIAHINTLVTEYLDSPEFLHLASLHPDIEIKGILGENLPNISCSPVHVKKCLMNLVTNGVEASVSGEKITITTSCFLPNQQWAENNNMKPVDYIVLAVEDSGSGISTDDLGHIFEPFYTKKVMGRSGTGLGLAVVWNTMEDHDGKVIVKSSEHGTQFQLFFPADKEHLKRLSDGRTPEPIKGDNQHILVIDDEPSLCDIACGMLESFGYTADSVSSGEAAVHYLQNNSADLVILDMIMDPGINGLQTYEKILELIPAQKAIIASGFSESEDVKATLKLGAGGFIKKPYSMTQLEQAVGKELKRI